MARALFASWYLALAHLVVVIASKPVSAQKPKILPVENATHWAFKERGGRAFVALEKEDAVAEYGPKGELRRWNVGGEPNNVIINGPWLVAACKKANSLYFVNLKSNEIAGSLKLSENGPYFLFSSNAADPYVYALSLTRNESHQYVVFQIDLRNRKIRRQSTTMTWRQTSPAHVVMSRDGNWIMPDARGLSSPSGADLIRVDSDALEFQATRNYHDTFGQVVPGPLNRFWTLGNHLYTLDIREKVRSFSGSVCAIHPRWDLVASLGGQTLYLEKLSDSTRIEQLVLGLPEVEVDSSVNRRTREFRDRGNDYCVKFDLTNNHIFVGTKTGCAWVKLSGFESQLEPLRMIRTANQITSLVNQPLKVPVAMTNADVKPAAKLEVTEGPEGVRLENGNLVWTPKDRDLGIQQISLALKTKDGKQLDNSKLTVNVTLPKVDLDFHPRSMKVSPNGKRLIAWGPKVGEEGRHPAHTGNDGIAVIDTENRKVLAAKSLPQGIRDVEITDEFAIIAPASGSLVYRFDHQLANPKRQFMQSSPRLLRLLTPSELLVVGDQTQIFDVKTLKSIQKSNRSSHDLNQLAFGDSVSWAGRVTDRRNGALLRVESSQLPALASGSTNHRASMMSMRNQGTMRAWGRQLTVNGYLSNHAGGNLARPSNVEAATMSTKWPVSVMVSTENVRQIVTRTLKFCDLIDGKVRSASTLSSRDRGQSMSHYGVNNRILANGNSIYVIDDTSILFAQFPNDIVQSLPVPPHFDPMQTVQLIVGGKKSFELKTRGRRVGLAFALLQEFEFVEIDEASGVVSVDTDAIWDKLAKGHTGSGVHRGFGSSRTRIAPSTNAKLYEESLGRQLPSDKYAIQIPIVATLADEEGQSDQIVFSVALLGPRAPFDEQERKQAEEQQRQIAEANKRREEARLNQEAAMKAAMAVKEAQKTGSVEERLQNMEARLRRIEAALDGILRKLEKNP